MTYSIVGYDARTGDFGVAVATKFLAVGVGVPWVSEHGAIAVQAVAHPPNGKHAEAMLADGLHPEEIVRRLTDISIDSGAPTRQLAIVDRHGRAATFTGDRNGHWSGGVAGPGYAAQGNMLTDDRCVPAMVKTFLALADTGLPRRLALSLLAGEEAGGDSRGRESAALQVFSPGAGFALYNGKHVDVRVDDHRTPCHELLRLIGVWERILGVTSPEQYLPLDRAAVVEIQTHLASLGEYAGTLSGQMDDATETAWKSFLYKENFRFRRLPATPDGKLDPIVLARLRECAAHR